MTRPIMAKTDCDVVHCPTVENKHWMFDPRLADVVNRFAHFSPFSGTRDSVLANIGCMCWSSTHGRVMVFRTNL